MQIEHHVPKERATYNTLQTLLPVSLVHGFIMAVHDRAGVSQAIWFGHLELLLPRGHFAESSSSSQVSRSFRGRNIGRKVLRVGGSVWSSSWSYEKERNHWNMDSSGGNIL